MSTFGPIWISRDVEWAPGDVPLPIVIPDGSVIEPGVRPYFWDVQSDDDLKPVVHAKSLNRHAWDGTSAYNGKTVLIRSDAFVDDKRYNHVIAYRARPGITYYAECDVGRSKTAGVDSNYGTNGFIMKAAVITAREGADSRYRRRFIDEIKLVLEYTADQPAKTRITGVVAQTQWGTNLGYHLIAEFNAAGIPEHFGRGIGGGPNWIYGTPRVQPQIHNFILDWLESMPTPDTTAGRIGYNWYSFRLAGVELNRVVDARSAFMFGEPSIETFGVPGNLGFDVPRYWVNMARSRAFVDACEHMPSLSDNSISNLQEIFEFLLSVIRREPPKIPSSLSEIWLGYRYQYSTTKMDLEEAWTFVNRYCDIGSMFQQGVAHGEFSFDYNNVKVTCRCAVEVSPTTNRWYNDLGALWRNLSTLGLAPDLYYLWDSTPFSFIVDWFVPVGTVLEAVDASMLYTAQNYKFGRIVYSLKYTRDDLSPPVQCYSRWIENSTPAIVPCYWLEGRRSASTRQVVYRALDAVSLFIGGK